MPIQYLVPCSCGRKVPVETRNAGETITCACGLKLEVPRLLELKKLEKVSSEIIETKPAPKWGLGQGLILAGCVLLLAVVLLWLMVISLEPGDPYLRMTPEQIRMQSEKMSPSQTLKTWLYFKQVGINPRKERIDRYFEGLFAQRQMILAFLGIAAAGGIAFLVSGIFLARPKTPKRSSPPPT